MVKIIFANETKINKRKNRITKGDCMSGNRNRSPRIKIYKGHRDKLRTLIHEVIHSYLFEKSKKGYKSRFIDKLNDDENFVDGLAVEITKAIKENKEEIIK